MKTAKVIIDKDSVLNTDYDEWYFDEGWIIFTINGEAIVAVPPIAVVAFDAGKESDADESEDN
jgi:hypothetical protein